MELFNKAVQKFAKKASIVVTDSVKTEAKKTAISILPTLIGIGGVIAGFAIFRSSLAKPVATVASAAVPTLSRTSIVTNNWFLGKEMTAEILEKVMKEGLL